MLSADLLSVASDEIKNIVVNQTWVGGRCVFDGLAASAVAPAPVVAPSGIVHLVSAPSCDADVAGYVETCRRLNGT